MAEPFFNINYPEYNKIVSLLDNNIMIHIDSFVWVDVFDYQLDPKWLMPNTDILVSLSQFVTTYDAATYRPSPGMGVGGPAVEQIVVNKLTGKISIYPLLNTTGGWVTLGSPAIISVFLRRLNNA